MCEDTYRRRLVGQSFLEDKHGNAHSHIIVCACEEDTIEDLIP